MIHCTYADGAARCDEPAVAVYKVKTTLGTVDCYRCDEHDRETMERYKAQVGGIISRKAVG